MFHNTKNTYRAINGLKYLCSNILRTHNNKFNTKLHRTLNKSCSTVSTSPTFKRGIAQVAKQERLSPIGDLPDPQKLLDECITKDENKGNNIWLDDQGLICVAWEGVRGKVDKYPSVWLRDNCQCSDCFDPSSRQRKLLLRNLDADIQPASLTLCPETNEIHVIWPDEHLSIFKKEWLEERNFTGKPKEKRLIMADKPKPRLWGASSKGYRKELRRHKYKEIQDHDHSLYLWLKDLQDFGLTLVEDMPEERESLRTLMNRVGCIRSTHYGDIFHVVVKANANNLAYLPVTLGLHIDLPYYGYNPGTQFLHCLAQEGVIGGENEFADGFYVERLMRDNYPNEWRILHSTKVEWNDIGQDMFGSFCKVKFNPIFQLDENGEINRISYSNQVRDSFMTTVAPDSVKQFYKALLLMDKLLYENVLHYKLNAGECVVFDNLRILHGRKGFDLKENGERTVQGGYVDWDEVRSKINILKLVLGDN